MRELEPLFLGRTFDDFLFRPQLSPVATRRTVDLTMPLVAGLGIGVPIVGRLSDRFGRRPLILLGTAAGAVSFLILGFARSLPVLFAARILAGFLGGRFHQAPAHASLACRGIHEQVVQHVGARRRERREARVHLHEAERGAISLNRDQHHRLVAAEALGAVAKLPGIVGPAMQRTLRPDLIDLGGDDEYAYPAAQQGLGVAPFQAQYAKVTYNPGPYTYYANSLGLLLDAGTDGNRRHIDKIPACCNI